MRRWNGWDVDKARAAMTKSVRQWIRWQLIGLLLLITPLCVVFVLLVVLLTSMRPEGRTFDLVVIFGFLMFGLIVLVANVILSLLGGRRRLDLRSDGLFDLCSIDALNEQEPSRRKLYKLLLVAIRDGRTRLRLEPCRHDYRVYGTVNDIERELVPLDRDEGSKVITAMKVFAGQNAAGSAESGVQLIPILVGGHRVSLSLETLRYGEEEGISIRVEDHSLNTAAAEGETGSTPSSFVKEDCEGQAYIDELQALVNRIGIRRDELHSVGCDTECGQVEKRSGGSQ